MLRILPDRLEFSIVVIEPICYVRVENNMYDFTVHFKITSGKQVNLDWGDGTVDLITGDGTEVSYSHYYPSRETYPILVTGDCEDVLIFTTGGHPVEGPIQNFQCYTNLDELNIIDPHNFITGNIIDIPRTLTTFTIRNNDFLSGEIKDLPTNLEILFIEGDNNIITGDISDLPQTSTDINIISASSTINGDISNLPPNLTRLGLIGQGQITGDTADFSSPIHSITLDDNNIITGDVVNISSSISFFRVYGNNTITGNINTVPTTIYDFYVKGNNTIYGDLGCEFVRRITYFELAGNNTIDSYTPISWSTDTIMSFTLIPVDPGGLNTTDIDNLLIDWDSSDTITSYGHITLTGSCESRSAASDDAVANMESRGITITLNTV